MLVRTARTLAPASRLVVVEAAAPGLGDEVQREKRRVLEHYRVATLDWKGAYASVAANGGPSLWHPGPIPGTTATDMNHPSWVTHQQIADQVSALWERAARRACRHNGRARSSVDADSWWWPSAPLWSAAALGSFDVCLAPLSVYSDVGTIAASRVEQHTPASPQPPPPAARGWRYYADRPNKYGWIAQEAGASIRFELRVGAAPRFCLTYLRSYEDVGVISLSLVGGDWRVVVDALWADRASQSDVLWFGTTPGHDTTISYNTHYVPGLLPNTTRTLEATVIRRSTAAKNEAARDKFKIIQLVSC